MKRFGIILAAMLTAGPLTQANAQSDNFPTKDIRLIVPFSPGGNTDILARIVAKPLAEELGATIFVDNRPGAGGSLGTGIAARSESDGHTLLFVSGSHVFNPSILNLPYDTLNDFVALGLVSKIPNVLLAPPSLAAHTAEEAIAFALKNPGKLNYASAGIGTGAHLSMEYFKSETGMDIVHVPYKGNSNATADLLGAKVDLMMGAQPAAMGHLRSGSLKALAITSAERSAILPDVPTISECCVEGFEFVQGFGLLAPAGTPDAVVRKINEALQVVLNDPQNKEKLANLGAEVALSSPDEHQTFIKSEIERWGTVIKNAGIERQ